MKRLLEAIKKLLGLAKKIENRERENVEKEVESLNSGAVRERLREFERQQL